jgi:hypothetical protein
MQNPLYCTSGFQHHGAMQILGRYAEVLFKWHNNDCSGPLHARKAQLSSGSSLLPFSQGDARKVTLEAL